MSAAGTHAVEPRTDPLWSALTLKGGNLFTSPPWVRAVCDSYSFQPHARLQTDPSGTPVAGFVWVDVHDLHGRRRKSMPFSDRADPIVNNLEQWAEVSADALAAGPPLTIRFLEDSVVRMDPRLVHSETAAWHETPLGESAEELFRRFRPQTRRNIAASEHNGVEVELRTDLDAVRIYHGLHVALRKSKYRLLAQPRDFFERIWLEFAPADAIRTAIARVAGKPVAGAIYLVWRDVLYYKFGASLAEYLGLRPNDAVHWAAMRWATERGLRAMDWGLSDLNQPGLLGYKRKWGSTERRILTYGCIRQAECGDGIEDGHRPSQTLGELTRLLTSKEVPDSVTERAGALLYRNFS